MLKALKSRLQQGHRTSAFPRELPALPDRFLGRPELEPARCVDGCSRCLDSCPTDALTRAAKGVVLDLGRCLFCGDCVPACPEQAIRFSTDHRLAVRRPEDLLVEERTLRLAEALEARTRRVLGRALRLRQVSAAGCNACEADVNVLGTLVFDLGRFGIQFVASPRHADGLLVTGPVSANMELALRKTWEAVPEPKLVVAVGACAISGGPYAGHAEVCGGAPSCVPVDLYVPGCPPHPWTILDGLLRLIGRM